MKKRKRALRTERTSGLPCRCPVGANNDRIPTQVVHYNSAESYRGHSIMTCHAERRISPSEGEMTACERTS